VGNVAPMLAPHSLAAAALGRNKRGRGKREGDFKGQKKIAAAPQRRADAQADKVVNLVAAMEAEEKCMLEALQKLDEARKAAQMQCQVAHERLREREQENQRLCVRASEALETADAAVAAEGELRSFVQEAQEREREREREIAALSSMVERLQAELQARDVQIRGMQAQEDETESRVQDLLDEIARWKQGVRDSEFEVQELQRKWANTQHRHQDLTVRYERMEATLHASRQASEDSKLSKGKEIAAREQQYKKEIDALNAQLRSVAHVLQDSRERFEAQLSKISDEARKEAQLRKEAEAREEASRVRARELERKTALLHEQVEQLLRYREDADLKLHENAHRCE
jgi:chromosome segregation ATPase